MAKLPHRISILSLIFCLFPFLAGSSWVDPDTKAEYHHTKAHTKDDNRPYRLVRSKLAALSASVSAVTVFLTVDQGIFRRV